MPADKEAKPRYNLHRQSDAYVMLRDGDHPMCSICVKKTRGLLDAQLILQVMNSHKDLLTACELAFSELDAIATNIDPNVRQHIAYASLQAAIASTKTEQESAK